MMGLLRASARHLGVPSALLLLAMGTQSPDSTASVLVQVSDESGNPVGASMVVLQVRDGEEVIDEIVAESEDDGAVRFEEVPTGPGYVGVPFVVYNGYTYRGEEAALTPGADVAVPMTVYTAAEDGAELHIDVLHLVLTAVEPRVYQAVQVMQVLNLGEQSYFGGPEVDGQRSGLIIPFPAGARSVAPLSDISGLDASRLAVDGNRLLDLRALPPGTHQIAISYELVSDSGGSDVVLTLPYPTAEVNVLLGPDVSTARIESEDLREQTPQEIPGQGVYANWTSGVVDAGESVSFHLGPTGVAISRQSWSLLGLAMALLVTAAASIFGERLPQPDLGSHAALIDEVAALDEGHEAGTVTDIEYHMRRSNALERLIELDRRSTAAPARRAR